MLAIDADIFKMDVAVCFTVPQYLVAFQEFYFLKVTFLSHYTFSGSVENMFSEINCSKELDSCLFICNFHSLNF